MTISAWAMLLVTWALITFFTVRYFWMVLVLPDRPPEREEAADDLLERGA